MCVLFCTKSPLPKGKYGTDHTGSMSSCNGSNAIPAFDGITEEEYIILTDRRLG